MTHQPPDEFDPPLTKEDYAEIVGDTIDEAVHNLEHGEIEPLCRAIRDKISVILQEHRKYRPDHMPASEDYRDPNDRWWDRP